MRRRCKLKQPAAPHNEDNKTHDHLKLHAECNNYQQESTGPTMATTPPVTPLSYLQASVLRVSTFMLVPQAPLLAMLSSHSLTHGYRTVCRLWPLALKTYLAEKDSSAHGCAGQYK